MIYVVGVGPSREDLLTIEARAIIQKADLVVATSRLFEELKQLNPNSLELELGDIPSFIKAQEVTKNIGVLVSGDVGFYSLSASLKKNLEGRELTFINGLSSMQYFARLLGEQYHQWTVLSLHGREGSLVGAVSYNSKVFALTGGRLKAHDIIAELHNRGMKDLVVTVGENLSQNNQRIVRGSTTELKDVVFSDLAVILVENPRPCCKSKKLWDEDFVRGKAPMTKEAVRTVAIAHLDVQPDDLVYDIGAGTGSCTVELAMKAYNSTVYGIERKPEAMELLKENMAKLGTYNIKCIEAYAPEGLEELPPPDKVFIGGSGRELRAIVEVLIKKNPKVQMVATAITLESISETVTVMEEVGYRPRISCINASHSHSLGGYHMMKAENPIYIIASGERNEEC